MKSQGRDPFNRHRQTLRNGGVLGLLRSIGSAQVISTKGCVVFLAVTLALVIVMAALLRFGCGPMLTDYKEVECPSGGKKVVLCTNTGGGATVGVYVWVIAVDREEDSLDNYERLFQARHMDVEQVDIRFDSGNLLITLPPNGSVQEVEPYFQCGGHEHNIFTKTR